MKEILNNTEKHSHTDEKRGFKSMSMTAVVHQRAHDNSSKYKTSYK